MTSKRQLNPLVVLTKSKQCLCAEDSDRAQIVTFSQEKKVQRFRSPATKILHH